MNTLITGASSGIGEAIALECARRGDTLFLCGRDKSRLDSVVERCCNLGAKAYGEVVDVSDNEAVERWMKNSDSIAPVERVFANAGVATGKETPENIRRTVEINVTGVMNTVLSSFDLFFREAPERKVKQIIITSSIAGYGPLKSCPTYSATKSFLKTWGLSLRGMLAKDGIRVNVICPGFVKSRITDANTCPMPFFMQADEAAKIILSRVEANVALIAFPWPMRLASWALSIMPAWMNEVINRFLPGKVAER